MASENAQVRIYATDKQTVVGSGFLVGRREVLTCAHVVTCALGLPNDTPFNAFQFLCGLVATPGALQVNSRNRR